MQPNTSLNRCAGAALLLACGAGTALAADTVRISTYPPPGLYHVVSQGIVPVDHGGKPEMTQRLEQDSATGITRATITSPGAPPVTSQASQAPVPHCIKALPASGAMPATANCKTSAPVIGPGTLSYVSVCTGMKVNTTIKKNDGKNWEYTVAMNYGPGATHTMIQHYSRIASTCPASAAR